MSKSLAVIAIVDDDPSILNALELLLSSLGHRTELYDSPDAFLAAAARSQADCLILDIEIGGSCGIDLRHQLAQAGHEFPIIFMSGTGDKRVLDRAKKAGCIAILHKPFSASALLDALAKAGS
jgi:FixJ family two-component response regulator